jgi:hypothetical protein
LQHDSRLRIVGPRDVYVRKVFAMAGLSEWLPVYASFDEAVTAAGKPAFTHALEGA